MFCLATASAARGGQAEEAAAQQRERAWFRNLSRRTKLRLILRQVVESEALVGSRRTENDAVKHVSVPEEEVPTILVRARSRARQQYAARCGRANLDPSEQERDDQRRGALGRERLVVGAEPEAAHWPRGVDRVANAGLPIHRRTRVSWVDDNHLVACREPERSIR